MIGWITGKIMGAAGPYIIGISLGVIGLMGLSLTILTTKYINLVSDSSAKIERAQSNTTKLEQAVKDQGKEITNLLVERGKNEVRTEFRNKEMAVLQKDLDEERRKHESYKTRWANVANKKPELLARLINRATRKRVLLFSTATCRTDCDTEGNSGNSRKTTTEAGRDNKK